MTSMRSKFGQRIEASIKLMSDLELSAELKFGPWPINRREVFFLTQYSFGFVNLKPILPGHVLVSPRRLVERMKDLTEDEVVDLALSVQTISALMEAKHNADSVTVSIQDGTAAGQTVPHAHFHVIPRFPNDFKRNDEIYDKLDQHIANRNAKPDGSEDEERKPRSPEEMYAEAADIRSFFQNVISCT